MKKNIWIAIGVIVVVGGLAAYLFWPQTEPVSVHVQAPPTPKPPPPPVKKEEPKVAEAPPPSPPLPPLTNSDKFMLDALSGLVGNKSLMKVFRTEKIIKHIVATIDNLPGRRAPMSVMPVERARGTFITAGTEDDLTLSPMNEARYTPYVKVAEAIDAKKLVALYVRLYPLFQEAYEKLGYPKKYFNDRLMVALDDLLNAPVIKRPIKLVQPNVFYQFAESDLEERSIGQRILIRIGSKNEMVIKAKLREIKNELLLHMRQGKVASAGLPEYS
jgi:hypothetical protein